MGKWFEFVVPPLSYFGFLTVVVVAFLVTIEGVKRLFYARLLGRDRPAATGVKTS